MSGKAICERCGEPARIHITSERTGTVSMRHLCIKCVEIEPRIKTRRKRAFNFGAVLICIGGLGLFISLFADHLAFEHTRGFGRWQTIGMLIASAMIGTGAAMKIPTVMVIGFLGGGLALLADWLNFGSTPGFGRQQWLGSIVSSLLVGAGLAVVFLRKKWATAKAERQAAQSPGRVPGSTD
jgi:hypothetical protein